MKKNAMARRTIEMELKKQIDILKGLGYGKKTIARELGLARNTVKSYLETINDSSGKITNNDSRQADLQAYFPYCQSELQRRGVTRQILWGEYRGKYPEGYSYSQFCEYLKQWLDRKDVSLHIEQFPGDKMYIDFAGSKMRIVDSCTGEIKEVEEKHEERYLILAKHMDADTLYNQEKEMEWKCLNCGYIHKGKTPPTTCPVCKKPFTWYMALGLIR